MSHEKSDAESIQNSPKPSWFSGCVITALVILFAFLGVYNIIFGSVIAYIFSSARMLSPANIAIIFIIICNCIIYFFLVFRFKQQRWFVSLALLAVVWTILPFSLRPLINSSTMRLGVDGYAMGETLPNESFILADRLVYQKNDPQRGDIVVFISPSNSNLVMIKRVIGIPGESIEIMDGIVTINGIQLDEPYITAPPLYNGSWVVPENHFFVLGDNRNDSSDSHSWGYLPSENVLAKAVWIYYPLANFGKIVEVNFPP